MRPSLPSSQQQLGVVSASASSAALRQPLARAVGSRSQRGRLLSPVCARASPWPSPKPTSSSIIVFATLARRSFATRTDGLAEIGPTSSTPGLDETSLLRATPTTAAATPVGPPPSSIKPTPPLSSSSHTTPPPKEKRSLPRRIIRFLLFLNVAIFLLTCLAAGSIWVYFSYIAPAKAIYRRGRDGFTYAVGVYDSGKGWWRWSRGWYGWMVGEAPPDQGESSPREMRTRRVLIGFIDRIETVEVVPSKEVKKKGWFS